MDRKDLAPIGILDGFTFQRGSKRSSLDIMNARSKLLEKHKRSGVLGKCSASDHRYVLHEFRGGVNYRRKKCFKYSTKDVIPEKLSSFDDKTNKLLKDQPRETIRQEDYL